MALIFGDSLAWGTTHHIPLPAYTEKLGEEVTDGAFLRAYDPVSEAHLIFHCSESFLETLFHAPSNTWIDTIRTNKALSESIEKIATLAFGHVEPSLKVFAADGRTTTRFDLGPFAEILKLLALANSKDPQ